MKKLLISIMIQYRESMPKLDLHGEDRVGARILVRDFLNDNYKLENYEIAIIHGIGSGLLKREVHDMLRNSLVQIILILAAL